LYFSAVVSNEYQKDAVVANMQLFQNPPPNFKSTSCYIPFRDSKRNAGSAAEDLLLVNRNFADPIDFEHSYPSQSLCGDNPFHLRLIRKAMV
jgi:hypothetical protein